MTNTNYSYCTEEEYMVALIDLAHLFSWAVCHFRPAWTSKGYRTPVQADGAGFPDLILIRERIIYAEVKSEGGKLSDDQAEWLAMLQDAGAECYAWWPQDLDWIRELLNPISGEDEMSREYPRCTSRMGAKPLPH